VRGVTGAWASPIALVWPAGSDLPQAWITGTGRLCPSVSVAWACRRAIRNVVLARLPLSVRLRQLDGMLGPVSAKNRVGLNAR
jgi:hypothetical protein